jgi:hypothetical protein
MKKFISWTLYLIVWYTSTQCFAQSNMLSNGSFEGDFLNGVYPRFEEHLWNRNPSPWFQFNQGGEVRWFTDTTWTYSLPYPVNPDYQNGRYELGDFDVVHPWQENTIYQDSMYLMPAHTGQFYVGFDARSDGLTREGLQTKVSGCGLNSGYYNVSLYFARPYFNQAAPHIFLSLSDQFDDRRYIFDDFVVPQSTNTGQWYNHAATFQIDLNNPDHAGNDWFSVTGEAFGSDNPKEYTYFDDVRLYRPCDDVLECVPTHGQICPSVATLHAPGDLMRVSNIANASDLHLKIYVSNSQIIKDTVYHNANGLPDFRFTRLDLPLSTAAAIYQYDLEITNACGGFKKTGSIQVYDTSAYNPITPYVDTTANWSGVPIPCCLSALTLQNMQIVGDVSYIVRDLITVQGLVSLAPNSHVILQAGQVVEITSAEFDGSNSSLEIVEVPCPQRCAQGADCGGGAMVMDAGAFMIPAQAATGEAHLAPTASAELAKPAIETETRLWAYPNPFEREFKIGFTLPDASVCSLAVLDMQLRPVRTVLAAQEIPAGTHQLAVDLGGLPAGLYLVRLQAGDGSYQQRVVKL